MIKKISLVVSAGEGCGDCWSELLSNVDREIAPIGAEEFETAPSGAEEPEIAPSGAEELKSFIEILKSFAN